MSTETKKSMRRIKRPSRWEQVGINPELFEKVNIYRNSTGPWNQNGTTVKSECMTFEVGSRITGYEANGISYWNLLGAEDGRLLITTNSCPERVELSGRKGYTNGVEILNNVAQKYTNFIYADENARSINVDDVNRVTGYNPEKARYAFNEIWQYGNSVTYYWYKTYCPWCSGENGVEESLFNSHQWGFYYPTARGWGILHKPPDEYEYRDSLKEIITLRNTAYKYEGCSLIDSSSDAYGLLFKGSSYWLGSQCYCWDGLSVSFGLHIVNYDAKVFFQNLASSDGQESTRSYWLRPVVSLKSEVKVDSNGNITI